MTKTQIIAKLKTDYPTLTKSFDGIDSEMSIEEYDAQIQTWADIEMDRIANEEAMALKSAEKEALLIRLGITAEEAALLLS
jgi:hypothetical protein